MRKLILGVLALAVAIPAVAQTQVRGYVKKDGTYVAPHVRSAPNSTTLDNYSTRGNVNPYTGKAGTQDPYRTPSYNAPSYPRSSYPSTQPTKAPCYYNCPD